MPRKVCFSDDIELPLDLSNARSMEGRDVDNDGDFDMLVLSDVTHFIENLGSDLLIKTLTNSAASTIAVGDLDVDTFNDVILAMVPNNTLNPYIYSPNAYNFIASNATSNNLPTLSFPH